MAVELENDCVDCGLPCLGQSCPKRNVPHYYCDKCGMEISKEEVYYCEGEEVCEDCLKTMCKKEW